MKIYLDFDGTVVEHQYPKIGRCNFGCFEVIRKLQNAGHVIVLNTYRADANDGTLEQALNLINYQHVLIKKPVQNNEFKLIPISATSHKIHPPVFNVEVGKREGVLFIDDQAPNTPLKDAVMTNGKMVDWGALDVIFEMHGLYKS